MKLPTLLPLSTLFPLLTRALQSDYLNFGMLIAQNASYTNYDSEIKTAGCITDDFTWTIQPSRCGLFYGTRGKYYRSARQSQYVFISQRGLCGLDAKQKAVCGKWAGSGAGPLNETWDGNGLWGYPISDDAPAVKEEGFWWALNNTNTPEDANELRFGELGFKMWWSNGTPTQDKDVSLWNNVYDVHPESGVTLDQYQVGARIFWNWLAIP